MAKKKASKQETTVPSVEVEVLSTVTAEDFVLDEIDRKIIKFYMDYPTATQNDACAALGVTRSNLCDRKKKPAYMRAMADMTKDFIDLLKETQSASARRLRELVRDPDKSVALAAIKMAMAPYLNSSLMVPKTDQVIVHTVQFGEGGAMYRETKEINGTSDQNNPGTEIIVAEPSRPNPAADHDEYVRS